jgi:hypothetical protein
MSEYKIKNLISAPDNIERIRDQIAAILKVECAGQYEIAISEGIPDARDYKIGVWKERIRPWQLTEATENQNPFPLVNITLIDFKGDETPGATIAQKKYAAKFALDCYANGSFKDSEEPDDSCAVIKAQKIGRIIRNIITSEQYAYLGLRGIVRDWRITEGKIGAPSNIDQSALAVTICRLNLSVNYFEDVQKVDLSKLEEIDSVFTSPAGEVLFGINEDYRPYNGAQD